MTNVQKLKKLRVYSKYIRNMKAHLYGPLFDSLGDIDRYLNTVSSDWIIPNAFFWDETPEGYDFWADIDKKFLAL